MPPETTTFRMVNGSGHGVSDIEIRFRSGHALDVGGLDVVIEVRTRLFASRADDKQLGISPGENDVSGPCAGPLICVFFGADDEIRTRDPHLGKVMLYQLSHVRAASDSSK